MIFRYPKQFEKRIVTATYCVRVKRKTAPHRTDFPPASREIPSPLGELYNDGASTMSRSRRAESWLGAFFGRTAKKRHLLADHAELKIKKDSSRSRERLQDLPMRGTRVTNGDDADGRL